MEVTVLRNFPKRCVMLVIFFAGRLSVPIITVSLKQDVLAGLAVLLKLSQYCLDHSVSPLCSHPVNVEKTLQASSLMTVSNVVT